MNSSSIDEAVVNAEVEWGRTYRHQRKQIRRGSLAPTSSPFDIQQLWEQYQMSKEIREIKELKRKLHAKPIPVAMKSPKGTIDPDTVCKKVYYNYLSTPRQHPTPPPIPPKPKHVKEKCSPRLIYLSIPTKVRVLSTWKDYQWFLPIDFILRLEELLHTDHNLDPKFARCYFKTLDRIKRKQQSKLRRKCRKKRKRQEQANKKWLEGQIKLTTDLLVEFLKKEPLFSLSFKQMMLSETILKSLRERGDIRRIPPRNSNKPYSRAVIDIVDQLSVWVDTIVRFVDVQYTESTEQIVAVPSLESMLGEEEEEEEEEEEREPPYVHPPLPPLPHMPPLPTVPKMPGIREEMEGGESSSYGTSTIEGILEGGGESEASIKDLSLRGDTLELLIKILSYSSPEMLKQEVNPDVLPDVTYQDILDRLHDLRNQTVTQLKKERKTALEEAMLAWAKSNQPDQIDKQIVGKIQDAAGILSECLGKEEKAAMFKEVMSEVTATASDETTFSPVTTEVDNTTSGEVTTEESPLDEYEAEASAEGRALETVQEEGGATTTSAISTEHEAPSVESKIGELTVKPAESQTKLPTVESTGSQRGHELSDVGRLEMTSELKIVMGEMPTPELSQNVLGIIAEEGSTSKVGAAATSDLASATTLPFGSSEADVTLPGEPVASARTESGTFTSELSTDLRMLPAEEASGKVSAASGKVSTTSGKVSAASGKVSTTSGKVSAASGKVSTAPGVLSGASLPSKGATSPGIPVGAPKVPPGTVPGIPSKTSGVPGVSSKVSGPGVSKISELPSGAQLPLRPGMALSQGISKSSIPYVIPGHKPSKVFEHQPDTICCLTLKVWATWLLEVAHNAHAWSRWLNDIINEVRRIASVIRGEVKDEDGNPVVFYKEDWIEFSEKVDNMITSWRQYSMHVKDLTDKIVHNFRGKTVTCCAKCLEDNLIVDISLAHNISQQLAEAMNTAGYWRRWLDSVVMETKRLTRAPLLDDESQVSSYGTMELIKLHEAHAAESEESLYEIEELDPTN